MKLKKWVLGASFLSLVAGLTVQAHEWQNNPRYVDFKQHQNAVSAIDLDSTYVVKYEPPIYIIGGSRVMGTAWNSTGWHYGQFQWRFNYDTKLVENYNQFNGQWVKVVDMDHAAIDGVFKRSYLIPFFGPNPLKQADNTQDAARANASSTPATEAAIGSATPTVEPATIAVGSATLTAGQATPAVGVATSSVGLATSVNKVATTASQPKKRRLREPQGPRTIAIPVVEVQSGYTLKPGVKPLGRLPVTLSRMPYTNQDTEVPTGAVEQEAIEHNPFQPVEVDVKK